MQYLILLQIIYIPAICVKLLQFIYIVAICVKLLQFIYIAKKHLNRLLIAMVICLQKQSVLPFPFFHELV